MSNNLFPVFLKLEELQLLIVGGGYVGMEKLNAILSNAPSTPIKIVAISISDDIKTIAKSYPNIQLTEKPYHSDDLNGHDIIIAAINEAGISKQIAADAKSKKILINVADKPELCDFYLGAVVNKGHLKIAISTNGKSPTIAKRVKEMLNETLPNEMDELLNNMQNIRNSISGDFTQKVKELNEITKNLSQKK